MRILDKELENRKINYSILKEYGFTLNNKIYTYNKLILDNQFEVIININNDVVTSKLIEIDVGDEYLLASVEDATGEYVGTIKEEYNSVIKDFISKCTTKEVFKNKQTKEIIKYIKDKYNDDLEFLWKKFDDDAIWRNKNNNKWYGVLLTVKASKFGIESLDTVEVIDLRYSKDKIKEAIDNKKIFPGYHMNKDSWITIILDGSMDTKEIFKYIDNSYNIIAKPTEWIIPANPKYFDVISYLNANDTVTWHQANNIHIGDIVYIYVGAPFSALMYKCIVKNVDIPSNYKDDSFTFKKAMTVDVVERYKEDKYPYSKLKECGVSFIRGPRTITQELSKELNKND